MDIDAQKIESEIKLALVELFGLAEADIVPDAHLADDLGLDSIDAIDMMVRLQNLTGKKFKPENFKTIRTVADMQRVVKELLEEPA